MLYWMQWTKNEFKVSYRKNFNLSHRKQVKAPSIMKLVTSLMNFECQPYGIFEGFSYHQEDEAIDTNIFSATVGLGNRIRKVVSSKFMGMVSSVLVIFDNGDTYSSSSNKGYFVNIEEKIFQRNLKGIAKKP